MDASLMNARALRVRFSKSLASRRHRLSQANVRSTTQRLGKILNSVTSSDRLTIPHQTDLVLDLSLLPARRRIAGDRINQIVAAHLQEAPVVGAFVANEDRLHHGVHVVVDAADAGA